VTGGSRDAGRLEEGLEVLDNHAVRHGVLGVARPVVRGDEGHGGDIDSVDRPAHARVVPRRRRGIAREPGGRVQPRILLSPKARGGVPLSRRPTDTAEAHDGA